MTAPVAAGEEGTQDSGAPPLPASPRRSEKEVSRLEAFSDGVMAIAITLLVIELHVPSPDTEDLLADMLAQWPSYFAFLSSFMTILIAWMNHHRFVRLLAGIDGPFMFLNGLLLMSISLFPYATAVVATHILGSQAQTAELFYAGDGLFVAAAFFGSWRYATKGRRLVKPSIRQEDLDKMGSQWRWGPIVYLLAMGLAFVSPLAAFGLCAALPVFFAVTVKL